MERDQSLESRHRFLATTRQRVIATSLVAVIAGGIVGAKFDAIKYGLQRIHDDNTQVDNPYYQPSINLETSVTDSSDPRQKLRVSVTELRQEQSADSKAAAKEKKTFLQTNKDFNDGISFFQKLNPAEVRAAQANGTQEKFAFSILKSFTHITDGLVGENSDGVQLFKEIVDDDTQAALKRANITVQDAPASDANGGAETSGFVSLTQAGRFEFAVVQLPSTYLSSPEGSAPFYNNTTSSSYDPSESPTKLEQVQAGIDESHIKMFQVLQAQKDHVAQERIDILLDAHPDLLPGHKHRLSITDNPHINHELYSASAELSRLNNILSDREQGKMDRAQANRGEHHLQIQITPPQNTPHIPNMSSTSKMPIRVKNHYSVVYSNGNVVTPQDQPPPIPNQSSTTHR